MASEVKDKLIISAISVFAEHGYRHGKVADIVQGADANIAAVTITSARKIISLFMLCGRRIK